MRALLYQPSACLPQTCMHNIRTTVLYKHNCVYIYCIIICAWFTSVHPGSFKDFELIHYNDLRELKHKCIVRLYCSVIIQSIHFHQGRNYYKFI